MVPTVVDGCRDVTRHLQRGNFYRNTIGFVYTTGNKIRSFICISKLNFLKDDSICLEGAEVNIFIYKLMIPVGGQEVSLMEYNV